MVEVEVKLPVKDLETIEKQLIEMDFRKASHVQETDLYFDNEEQFICSSGQAMRIRKVRDLDSGQAFAQVNFKGPKLDSQTMSRLELETQVKDGDVLCAILGRLGYKGVEPYVVKTRTEYKRGPLTACLDQVQDLGSFLELEIVVASEKDKPAALARIRDVLESLGYTLQDTVTTSYLSQLLGSVDEN